MIRTEKATKRFGTLLAVDHVDTEIHEGSVFGLIGSNGAGKSTFLRMLAGILAPDEGIVRIDEQEVYENEAAFISLMNSFSFRTVHRMI